MNSLILRTATPFLVSLTVMFSIFVLFRGHDEPGGGFIGGLIAASSLAIFAITHGPDAVRRAIVLHPVVYAALGLLFAAASGLVAFVFGEPYLTGKWFIPEFDPDFKLIASPVLFDIGVWLVVVGSISAFILALEDGS
jgi:multicomponent Na+:H+ antiporter subunit B